VLAVETNALSRVYKGRTRGAQIRALDAVSLSIPIGEVHGLLGPNGAGKTTLVKVLSTVLLPSEGSAAIFGHDVARETKQVRQLIGIVFGGDRGVYPNLTGRQNLMYWAALNRVPARECATRVAKLLERVGLGERADEGALGYSRGMKQRLHLARGLVGDARVLFLDEPTIGMDPLAARDFRTLVHELRGEGRTILITTHDMAEAESVCDRVSLIDHGRLLAVETPSTLARLVAKHERIDIECAHDDIVAGLRDLPGVSAVSQLTQATSHRIELADGSALQQVLSFLVARGVTSIRTSRPSLDEVYVHWIGDRGLRV
jgi:ABC-2 type transport system ATP-binding protein